VLLFDVIVLELEFLLQPTHSKNFVIVDCTVLIGRQSVTDKRHTNKRMHLR